MRWLGRRPVRRTIAWLLFSMVVFYGVSGFGITRFRIVEPLTLGLFTRNLAFRVHVLDYLWLPFLVLLGLHIYLALRLPHR